jgi:Glucosamine 6-phosphate synthetase, contains amidotransferase and phosphosugar isomerase domains
MGRCSRGGNGTGVFKINFQDETEILKKPGDPSYWFYAQEKEKFSMFGQGLIGHNRATTKGQNIEEHTHPFKENGITLVHNGTIINHNTLGDRDVDSHVICDLLSTGKTPQDLINTLKGFYALIWYNEQTKNYIC